MTERPTTGLSGPHGCRPYELSGVIRLVDAAMRPGSMQSMRTDYPLAYAPGNLPNVQVVTQGGRVIATAPVLPRRVAGDGSAFGLGVISPTATDPAYRHRGHGSACVAACVRRMGTLGLELSVLWTLVATFPFYEGNGWQAVTRTGAAYLLAAEDAGRFAGWSGPVVRLADEPGRLAEVMALHDATGAGVVRAAVEATALWFLPRMTTWLALDGGRVAAYLVDSEAINKPGLLEAAGDDAAVAGLVGHALERRAPGGPTQLHVGVAPDGLAGAVRAALPGRVPDPSTDDMMVRLNDPVAFLRAIRGWLEAHTPVTARRAISMRVVDAAVTVSLDWSGSGLTIGSARRADHAELTRRELTAVLFGPHPERPVAVQPALAWLPPFPLPIPVLDRS